MAKAGETQDRCTQYALDVVSGKITAGEYVRLACQRHLDDIEKSKAAPYKYYFDVEKSEEIINFAEELTIAEGRRKRACDRISVPVLYFRVAQRVENKGKIIQTVQNVLCAIRQTERKIVHQRYFGMIILEIIQVHVRKNQFYG